MLFGVARKDWPAITLNANSCIFSIWVAWSGLGFESGYQAVGDEILNLSKRSEHKFFNNNNLKNGRAPSPINSPGVGCWLWDAELWL